jgi:SAM-dependent methyltransferase
VLGVLSRALAAAWQREGKPLAIADARTAIAERCIAGIDVDARAVEVARARLGAASHRLLVGDALALDWADAVPDAFARGGFDAVVGNPPYIRQESLDARAKAALRGFASYDGVADLYIYFIELAHRIIRPGGRYCLITPNKWLTAAYGRPLRAFLAKEASVDGVVDLSRAPLFDGADAFPSIVWGTAGASPGRPLRAARVAAAEVLDEPGDGRDGVVAAALRGDAAPHDRERWRAEPWHIDAPVERALIERIERAWPALGSLLEGRPARGVVTGCNRAFVIDRATRDRLLEAQPEAAPLIRPFVKGRDVRPWLPDPAERWILLVDRGTSLDELPAIAAHLARFRAALEPRPADWTGAWKGRKPGAYRWFELQDPVGALAASRAPRLLYQDIQTGPACCLARSDAAQDALVPDTTVWILPSADPYLLAVLNSALYGWYARRRFPPALNGAVRPKQEYLRALPIATPAPAARAQIEALVEQRLGATAAAAAAKAAKAAKAAREARDLDAAIEAAVLAAYELSPAERAVIAKG